MDLDTSRPTWLLRLNNPPVNAFGFEQFDQMVAHLDRALHDDQCRALVIAGANGVFSAGVNIRLVPTLDAEGLGKLVTCINRLSTMLYGFAKPVVAAVDGHAIGLGAVILCCADFRIGAHGSYRVGLNELDAGLQFPACAAEAVIASLSPGAARQLCLGAQLYPPGHALLAELIDEFLSPEDLIARAFEIADDRGRQPIYANIKKQLRTTALVRMETILETGADPLLYNH